MEKIEFKVSLTEEDLIDYNMKIAYGRVSTWALMGISILIVSFTLYGVIFKPEGIVIDWTVIVTAIFAASYLFVMPTLIKASAKTVFKKNAQYKRPFVYELSEAGIKVKMGDKYSVTKWDDLYKFVETKENLLIHVARGRAFIVPKRCLEGEEMVWNIKQMVKEYVDMSRLSVKYKTK